MPENKLLSRMFEYTGENVSGGLRKFYSATFHFEGSKRRQLYPLKLL
jgi:hypothetical protein